MATTNSYTMSTPGFVVDPHSIMRDLGRQINFTRTSATRKNATTGKKVIEAGTVVSKLATGKVVPTADTEQTITGVTEAAGVATATKTAHGYAVGDKITISGATGGNAAVYNAEHTILTVPDANTFTFAVTASSGNAAGTLTGRIAAFGILETQAEEDSHVAALSGYGVVLGGSFYENVLPDATGTPAVLPAAWKTELEAAGHSYYFRQYTDSRL